LTVLASSPGSIVPFSFESVSSVKDVGLVISTRALFSHSLARRFTESNRARSRLFLKLLATFWRLRLLVELPRERTAAVVRTDSMDSTTRISMRETPRWDVSL